MTTPIISKISYHSDTGTLQFTGSNITASKLNVIDFVARNGIHTFTLTSNASISKTSSTGFTITLNNTDTTALNALFSVNGNNNNTYTLSSLSGWDGSGSTALNNIAVSVMGYNSLSLSGFSAQTTIADNVTSHPFSKISVADTDTSDKDNATISFTAANGHLTGSGLSAGVLNAGTITYTLAATTASTLASELKQLVFTPTLHQAAYANSIKTVLTLTVNGADSKLTTASDSSTTIIANSSWMGISSVSYNELTGVLNFSGNNLVSGVVLADLQINSAINHFNFSFNATDTLSKFSSTGFTVTLSGLDKATINNYFNAYAASFSNNFSLTSTIGWDGKNTPSFASAPVTVTGLSTSNPISVSGFSSPQTITDISAIDPFSTVSVSDSNKLDSVSATISFNAANGTLFGSGLYSGVTSGTTISYSLAATTPSKLQTELQSLLFTPTAHQATAGGSVTTDFILQINAGSLIPEQTTPVQVFTTGISNPVSFTVDTSHFYIANSNNIEILSKAGVLAKTISTATSNPTSIAVDTSGNIYIADNTKTSVVEFNSAGILINTISTGISQPYSIATYTDSTGSGVYIANAHTNTVEKIGANGNVLLTLKTGVSAPHALFVDSLSDVYVANSGSSNNVEEFSSSGTLLHTYTSALSKPQSLVVDSNGQVFVANDGNNSITEYASSGKLLQTITVGVAQPDSLSIDSIGNVFVANLGNNTVMELSNSGVLLETIRTGSSKILGLSSDSLGLLYVLDNNHISEYIPKLLTANSSSDSSTQVITKATTASISSVSYDASAGTFTITGSNFGPNIDLNALALTAGSNSYTFSNSNDTLISSIANVFVIQLSADDQNQVNQFFNSDGTSVNNYNYYFTANAGWNGLYADTISDQSVTVSNTPSSSISLSGLANGVTLSDTDVANPFTALKISDANPFDVDQASISFLAANGSLSGTGLSADTVKNGVITYTVSATTPSNLQTELSQLAFTPTLGQVASGNTVNTEFTLSIAGGQYLPAKQPSLTITNSLSQPYMVTTSSQGNIYAVNYQANNVLEYSNSGSLIHTISAGVSAPTSIAIDSSGDLFVGNSNNTVLEFDAAGDHINTLSTGIAGVSALAVDSLGDIFVGNKTNNTVTEYSSSGQLLHTLTTDISAPITLAVDPSGNVYVPGSNNTLQVFSAQGVLSTTLQATATVVQIVTDIYGDAYALSSDGNILEYYGASILNEFTAGVTSPSSIAVDNAGDVFVANISSNTISEMDSYGNFVQAISSGLSYPSSLAVDSQGDLLVANPANNTLEKFPASYFYLTSTTNDTSTLLKTTASQSFTPSVGVNLNNPTLLTNAQSGDRVTISDATSFVAKGVTDAEVKAANADDTTLAGWVTGALASQGTNLASHAVTWFNFNGNTYLLEQAGSQGSALNTSTSTLVEIVGVQTETQASFSGHTLILY